MQLLSYHQYNLSNFKNPTGVYFQLRVTKNFPLKLHNITSSPPKNHKN